MKPEWNAERRELRYDGRLVKRFVTASPCQIKILEAFEEEGWPGVIDDPLSPEGERLPPDRLRATIYQLNQHQENELIRFRGNGTGKAIVWEPAGGSGAPQARLERSSDGQTETGGE